jgi:hypothetical protein
MFIDIDQKSLRSDVDTIRQIIKLNEIKIETVIENEQREYSRAAQINKQRQEEAEAKAKAEAEELKRKNRCWIINLFN